MKRYTSPIAVLIAAVAATAFVLLAPDRGGQRYAFDPCEIREGQAYCAELESGAVAVITEPATVETERIVLLDPGGPGADLRQSIGVLLSMGGGGNIGLGFIEPWTTDGISEGCKAAAENFLSAMRQTTAFDDAEPALDLERDCEDETTNAKAFAQERIEVARYLIDQGPNAQVKYVGWSFATVRLASISSRVPIDGALIMSPVPHHLSWRDLMAQRAKASASLLSELGIDPGMTHDLSVPVPDRSVDLTPFDVAAGQYAATYDLVANSLWLPNAMDAYLAEDPEVYELAQLAYAADTVQGRYGVESLYVGIVGYWTEFCQALPQGSTASTEPGDSVAWFLDTFHQPCDSVEGTSGRFDVGADVSCLLVGDADPLVVGVGTGGWREPPTIVTVPDAGHTLNLDIPAVSDLVREFTTTSGYPCEL